MLTIITAHRTIVTNLGVHRGDVLQINYQVRKLYPHACDEYIHLLIQPKLLYIWASADLVFIATLQLGLLDCHNSTRKCWNKLVLLIMRFVIFIIHQGLENIETFHQNQDQDQDQDQDFFFKTKTFISRPRPFFMSSRHLETKAQGLETTSLQVASWCIQPFGPIDGPKIGGSAPFLGRRALTQSRLGEEMYGIRGGGLQTKRYTKKDMERGCAKRLPST